MCGGGLSLIKFKNIKHQRVVTRIKCGTNVTSVGKRLDRRGLRLPTFLAKVLCRTFVATLLDLCFKVLFGPFIPVRCLILNLIAPTFQMMILLIASPTYLRTGNPIKLVCMRGCHIFVKITHDQILIVIIIVESTVDGGCKENRYSIVHNLCFDSYTSYLNILKFEIMHKYNNK